MAFILFNKSKWDEHKSRIRFRSMSEINWRLYRAFGMAVISFVGGDYYIITTNQLTLHSFYTKYFISIFLDDFRYQPFIILLTLNTKSMDVSVIIRRVKLNCDIQLLLPIFNSFDSPLQNMLSCSLWYRLIMLYYVEKLSYGLYWFH